MYRKSIIGCLLGLLLAACSLPPERQITKQELYKTGIYSLFTIKESPESVLAALNREGEVVLDTQYKGTPYFVKILATSKGLQVHYLEK
ncbi:MAG TPA: hypothetical protein VIU41_09485 [Geobacteraceae bacterium]